MAMCMVQALCPQYSGHGMSSAPRLARRTERHWPRSMLPTSGAAAGHVRHAVRAMAIGFDLPGAADNGRSITKKSEELSRLASSLLLYQSVLRGKPAQAFLQVLQHCQGGPPNRLLESYGELFRLLAADGHHSWQDYVLEQVLRGVDNPLSRAAARGEATGHLHVAAAADLNALQQLALGNATLAGWVRDSVFGLPEGWVEAASSLGAAPPPAATLNGSAPAAFTLPAQVPHALLAPLSAEQRAAARGLVTAGVSSGRWGDAAEALVRFYESYGHGLLPNHRVLAWEGKLEGQDALRGVNALAQAEEEGLVAHEHHATKELVAALSAFLSVPLTAGPSNSVPPHAAVVGSPRDRWLQATYVLERLPRLVTPDLADAASGLRCVLLPASQLASLPNLAWSLHQHARCRFVVLLPTGLETASGARGELAALLSGYGGFSWPSNAVVLAGFDVQVPPELEGVFVPRFTASVEDISFSA